MRYHEDQGDGYCDCGAAVESVHIDDGTTFGYWGVVDQNGNEVCISI